MNIVATVQARMGSSRLPGKVLKPIVGKPMLQLQIERIQQSRLIDQVVIATSVEQGNDPIERLAHTLGVGCFRGSEEDCLSRIIGALKAFDVDLHAEFMGDSPLPDPRIIDEVIGYYLKHAEQYDYVSNALTITYPPGIDLYVYPTRVLVDAERYVTDPAQRANVDLHIAHHPERYRLRNLEAPAWFRRPDLHLEVDAAEDFEVISAIFEHFYPKHPGFGLAQIIEFLDAHPALAERNRHVPRRWVAERKVDIG
ncbi:MAG: glycosyltransferase family protein [Candidatus Omnitrophica bacterium]|nr:glycosyltransferase family protein [Candidatus Omnitrophota bacterium]